MLCEGIIFEKGTLRIQCQPHYRDNPSNTASPEEAAVFQREEDEWAAREVLGRLIVDLWPNVPPPWKDTPITESWQAYLMYLLKPVCRHYGVSDEKVLQGFLKHYLLSIATSGKHGVTLADLPKGLL